MKGMKLDHVSNTRRDEWNTPSTLIDKVFQQSTRDARSSLLFMPFAIDMRIERARSWRKPQHR